MQYSVIMNKIGEKIDYLRELLSLYNSVVIIGFKDKFHTHHYIHKQWIDFLDKIHFKHYWLENINESNKLIPKGSIVIYPDACTRSKFAIDFTEDNSYIFHRGELIDKFRLKNIRHLFLYEHRNRFVADASLFEMPLKLNPFVYAFKEQKVLIQPWGSPLLENEFYHPITSRETNKIFFVGTKWWANAKVLEKIDAKLKNMGYEFIIKNGLNTSDEICCYRYSYTSIAPGAGGHSYEAYLQCRIFKSISYGRLTFTDVDAFKEILGDYFISLPNLWDAIDAIREMSVDDECAICQMQQKAIRNYTYLDMWINMIECLNKFN